MATETASSPRQQHVPQADLQLRRVEVRVPGADRAVLRVEDPHEAVRQVADLPGADADVRALDRARRGQLEIAEIRRVARTGGRLRHVQA
jgi:hypothetical protein